LSLRQPLLGEGNLAKKKRRGGKRPPRRQVLGYKLDVGDAMAFSLSAMGQSISGRLTVDDQAVHLTVALPWLLGKLAESLKPRIEQRGQLLLARQTQEAVAENRKG
jgi:hypothetical protein